MYKAGLKKRIRGVAEAIRAFENRTVLTGLAGYFISLVIYLYALANAPLSVVYPVFASTFVFVTILSAVKLKEGLPPARILGVVIVVIGIIIVSTSA